MISTVFELPKLNLYLNAASFKQKRLIPIGSLSEQTENHFGHFGQTEIGLAAKLHGAVTAI